LSGTEETADKIICVIGFSDLWQTNYDHWTVCRVHWCRVGSHFGQKTTKTTLQYLNTVMTFDRTNLSSKLSLWWIGSVAILCY